MTWLRRDELFENDDLTDGNLWLVVVAWIAVGPAVTRAAVPMSVTSAAAAAT